MASEPRMEVNVHSAASTALGMQDIIEEIISYLDACDNYCCPARAPSSDGEEDFACETPHTKILFTCLCVSKVWSLVAIPRLWNCFATLENLMSVMYDDPPRGRCFVHGGERFKVGDGEYEWEGHRPQCNSDGEVNTYNFWLNSLKD